MSGFVDLTQPFYDGMPGFSMAGPCSGPRGPGPRGALCRWSEAPRNQEHHCYRLRQRGGGQVHGCSQPGGGAGPYAGGGGALCHVRCAMVPYT